MKNLKTQGFILLDVDVVALNNAGKNASSNFDNAVATKKYLKMAGLTLTFPDRPGVIGGGKPYKKNHGWKLSPITRESKIAFTAADPIKYADDDIFGYMKAAKDIVVDEEGNPVLDKKGKEQTENVTVTRVSPLKNSVIVSVGSTRTAENWSSMARQEGDSVPYVKEEYSAIMKGMFSLDLEQAGTFSNYNKTGFKNLTEKLKEEALVNGATEIEDNYVKDSKGNAQMLVRLKPDIRIKRVEDTLQALKTISGGAMQTNNMSDVTPKFIVLATTTTGNHPFSHIASSEGINSDKVYLNITGIKEVLKDYEGQIEGTVFIGRRSGFLDDEASALKELEFLGEGYPKVQIGSINETIDSYCEQLKQQLV